MYCPAYSIPCPVEPKGSNDRTNVTRPKAKNKMPIMISINEKIVSAIISSLHERNVLFKFPR